MQSYSQKWLVLLLEFIVVKDSAMLKSNSIWLESKHIILILDILENFHSHIDQLDTVNQVLEQQKDLNIQIDTLKIKYLKKINY